MESNIVSYILEHIVLFLSLGIIGIAVTILLYATGKKETTEEKEITDAYTITISTIRMNVFVIIYLFIMCMLILIGVLSQFIIPVIIGAVLAVIPLGCAGVVQWKSNEIRES